MDFTAEVLQALPYEPNEQQVQLVAALARFCDAAPREEGVFILNGYAGTGKTSLTGALVRTLELHKRKVVLLAPTGRAAKVFSSNSGGHPAFTIHRKIYRHSTGEAPGEYMPAMPAENKLRNAVFIVDEASMISGEDERDINLLDDLITYVFAGENSRLILMGDTAQLPPVGSPKSPAMNPDVLRGMGLKVSRAVLTETARQASDSGILFNATRLRKAMAKAIAEGGVTTAVPKLRTRGFDDVRVVLGEDMQELLSSAYDLSENGPADTIVITRSNKRASEYNIGIRSSILYREEELTRGDMLIVAKNHYFTKKIKGIDFIANGDIITVEKIYGSEVRYGIRFADVQFSLPSDATFPDLPALSFDAKIILDTLFDPNATLPQETWNRLYYGVLGDNERYGNTPIDERLKLLRIDPYWTALQVKYAYAVTCHKAQGGQWDNVFVDLSYIPDEALGVDLYRWLYTAVTRARRRLYLIAPPEPLLEV